MSSENLENRKNNEKVVDINAEERMPAVNSAPAIVDILREAIERAADNERKKVRRELFTINAVIIVFLIGITGIFLALAYNLVKELQAEREISRDLLIATMQQKTQETQQDDQDLSRTLRDILSSWGPEKTTGPEIMEQPEAVTSKDSSRIKPELEETQDPGAPRPDIVAPPTEAVKSLKAEVADLEAESEAINILAKAGKAENRELLTSMIEERDHALALLHKRIKKTHSTIINQSAQADPETTPVKAQESASEKSDSRYIAIDAAGTEMRILKPTP